MVTQHNVEQGTAEWLAARVGKFTGSNAHKLLGSMGATNYAKSVQSTFKGNFYTKRGHILEDEAIELYQAIRHLDVSRPGYITNDRFPACLYSPDGIVESAGTLIEVKCFGEVPHMKIFNGEIDTKILAQIHFGMMITELKKAQLVIYNPELEPTKAFKIIDIPVNRNIQNNFKRIISAGEVANAN